MFPEIIYEDENVLVLNKPSGLVVHDDGKQREDKEETLCDWVMKEFPEMENVGEPMDVKGEIIKRPGIVHRLDKETSGVIILAKNQDSFNLLKNQFGERLAKKVYNTVVWGNIKNDSGVVDAPIGRNGKDFRQWSATRGARGLLREAVTEYKVISRFSAHEGHVSEKEEDGEKFVFLEVRPKTGRTHQIRVHMKYLNNPIVGDKLYAENRPYVLGFERVALHARSLTIQIPGKSLSAGAELKTFEAPYPEDFLGLIARL